MPPAIVREWPTFQTFIDTAENGPTPLHDGQRASRNTGTWAIKQGTGNYDAAVKLARLGWPEGTSKARVLTDVAVDRISSILYRDDWLYSTEAGRGVVDPDRYIEGNPECVVASDTVEDTSARKAVHIVASVTASAGVDTDAMIARGAAVTALTELLTMSGHHVKVTLVDCRKSQGQICEYRVTLKDYMESFDVARFIYAAAHPSTLRRHCFSVNEQESTDTRDKFGFHSGGGYGMPFDGELRGDIYLGAMGWRDRDWTNPATTMQWILDQLRAQGVRVEA